MGVGDAGPVEGHGIWESLYECAELLEFSVAAEVEEVLLVVAVAFPLLLLHHNVDYNSECFIRGGQHRIIGGNNYRFRKGLIIVYTRTLVCRHKYNMLRKLWQTSYLFHSLKRCIYARPS